jgi:hypothetical protein
MKPHSQRLKSVSEVSVINPVGIRLTDGDSVLLFELLA